MSGGTAELTGSVELNGKSGGPANDGPVASGGNGGTVLISGGTLTLSGDALINLTPGAGGDSEIEGVFGNPGNPGSVEVTGGTLVLSGGLIKGDSSITPSADTINIVKADVSVTGAGILRATDHMTINEAVVTIDGAILDATAGGLIGAPGITITVDGAVAHLNAQGDAEILLEGGRANSSEGGTGDSLIINDGAFTLDTLATIDMDGGLST